MSGRGRQIKKQEFEIQRLCSSLDYCAKQLTKPIEILVKSDLNLSYLSLIIIVIIRFLQSFHKRYPQIEVLDDILLNREQPCLMYRNYYTI